MEHQVEPENERKTDPAPETAEAKRLAELTIKQLESAIPSTDIMFRIFLKLGELTDAVNVNNLESEYTRTAILELKDTVEELRESVTSDVAGVRSRVSYIERLLRIVPQERVANAE